MEINNKTDSTENFSPLPENHLERKNVVTWLHDRLSIDRKVIVVKGPDGSGKSSLLKEFILSHPAQCLSFFIGSDTWSSSPHLFLHEMCDQMAKVLDVRTDALDAYVGDAQLKQYFSTLFHRVAKLARQNKTNYYFIIDGLDLVHKTVGEDSISDLLPYDPPTGLYLIASSNNEYEVPFKHEPYTIQNFSMVETEHYLSGLNIPKEKISQIYSACDGMPGYLNELRSEILAGNSIEAVLVNLPNGFKSLLERKWDKYTKSLDVDFPLDLLAILSFSEIKLNVDQIGQLVSTDNDSVGNNLLGCEFLKGTDRNSLFVFVSDAHKKFVASKLMHQKSKVEALLIKFLETKPYETTSFQYLPQLYKRANQFDSLKKLINTDYIVRTLQTERDIDLLVKNAKLVTEIAYENSDWETLNKFSIVSALLNTLSTRTVGEDEIDALISMNEHGTAFNRAYQAILPEDRLELLARICYNLKMRGISLPEGIISELDDLVRQVKPTPAAKDKIIKIAADLFHINPNTASELLKKFGAKVDGKLLDIMLAVLSLKLDDEPDSANMLRQMITNESARDFALVNSPIIAKLEPDQVISEVSGTNDVSAKLYILRSWCNSNRKNSKAIKVVQCALEIMTSSTEYTPSMRHLRQIAEPLLSCSGEDVQEAIKRIDILKNTAITTPIDEKVRLELHLAAIEVDKGFEGGVNRLYETYFSLDSISDIDVRCYCLARFLIALPQIQPDDSVFQVEIEKRLRKECNELVENSADQFNIFKRIIRAITSVNPQLAGELVATLNTKINRDRGYYEILTVYIDNFHDKIEMQLIEETINKLSDKEKQDWAVVLTLKKLAAHNSLSCISENCRLYTDIAKLTDPRDQCYAYSYIANLYAVNGDSQKLTANLDLVSKAWGLIDSLWKQVETGFQILSIVGENSKEFSENFYKKILDIRSETPLAEANIVEVYINTIRLLIRTLPDILKGKDFVGYISQLSDSVNLVPSLSVQANLLGEIALHLYTIGKQQDGETFVREKVIRCLDSIKDMEERSQSVVKNAPVLFLYERTFLDTEINQLSTTKKEQALFRIIHYLVSKRHPDDPVDFDNLNQDVDYKTILQACSLIKNLSSDWAIGGSIEMIINLICRRDSSKTNQEICVLAEKQALTIANELNEIIKSKLPDKENIKHFGYIYVCQANLIRLKASVRSAMAKRGLRAEEDWKKIVPSANDLVKSINSISNLSDRAYIMAISGPKIYYDDIKIGHTILEDSKTLIYQINNIKDRADRLVTLADSWKTIDDKQSSIIFLKEAFTIASLLNWDSSRDAITGQILEMAHSINPEVASSLTSTIDNPLVQEKYKQTLQVKTLQNNPHDLKSGRNEDEIKELLDQAAFRLLKSFCSGRGYAQSERVVCDWLKHTSDFTYQEAYNVFLWAIENNLAMNRKIGLPQLVSFYKNLIDNLFLVRQIGETLTLVERTRSLNPLMSSDIETDLELYYAESEMRATTEKWLAENSGDCIRLYDGYFSINDLSILKVIKPTSRVDIFTLWKTQKGIKAGDREIETRFKNKWNEISDQRPPETHIYVVGVLSNGDGPIHDRYLICDSNGIGIGTSIGGLGNKDSGIHHLKEDEVMQVEQKLIFPLLLGSCRVFKDERLETFSFTL